MRSRKREKARYGSIMRRIIFFDQFLDRAWIKALESVQCNPEYLNTIKDDTDCRKLLLYFAAAGGNVELTKEEIQKLGADFTGQSREYIREKLIPVWQKAFEPPLFDRREDENKILLRPSKTLLKLGQNYASYLKKYMVADFQETEVRDIPNILRKESLKKVIERRKARR